jgi:hypothetical protein
VLKRNIAAEIVLRSTLADFSLSSLPRMTSSIQLLSWNILGGISLERWNSWIDIPRRKTEYLDGTSQEGRLNT